jgi:archaellum component FlaC
MSGTLNVLYNVRCTLLHISNNDLSEKKQLKEVEESIEELDCLIDELKCDYEHRS